MAVTPADTGVASISRIDKVNDARLCKHEIKISNDAHAAEVRIGFQSNHICMKAPASTDHSMVRTRSNLFERQSTFGIDYQVHDVILN